MAGEALDNSRNHQVLIRLTPAQSEVLSAAAYLRGATATEIVRTEVEAFLAGLSTSDRVQRLIRERREYEAEESGKLRAIKSSRRSRPKS